MTAGVPENRVEYLVMPTLGQRLRHLDRRVLREDNLVDAAGWAKAMGRWKLQLALAIFISALIALNIAVGNPWLGLLLLPTAIFSAFLAGRMLTEYERAIGKRTFMGKARPPSVDSAFDGGSRKVDV